MFRRLLVVALPVVGLAVGALGILWSIDSRRAGAQVHPGLELHEEENARANAADRFATPVSHGRPNCARVLSVVNRNISERGGAQAGSVAVAKRLKTDVAWVERCMAASGRIPAGRVRLSDDEREGLEEALEEGDVFVSGNEENDTELSDRADAERVPTRRPEKRRHLPTPIKEEPEFGPVTKYPGVD